MAKGAVRVDAGYARGREYSGPPLGLRLSLVLTRAGRGLTTMPRDGEEAQAEAEAREGRVAQEGGGPFFVRTRCGAPCLAPDPDDEAFDAQMCGEARQRFGICMRIDTSTWHGRRTTSDFGAQTKTARGG